MGFAAALCLLEEDPEPWFPDATLGRYKRQIAIERAKAICKACPSRAASLQMALDADIPSRHLGRRGHQSAPSQFR
jgi:hypothetical protein